MHLHVLLELGLPDEHLRARWALERSGLRVPFQMRLEPAVVGERSVAVWALVARSLAENEDRKDVCRFVFRAVFSTYRSTARGRVPASS